MYKSSWKTTLFGASGLVAIWVPVLLAVYDNDPATVPDYATAISLSLVALGLTAARDNNRTSEEVGAK